MYANNHTYNDIVHELNLKGYKTKIGNDFTGASLNSILNNRKYIGEYVYNKRAAKDLTGKHNSHLQKPEDEIVRIPNAIPRIIDDETFEKVAKRLEANKKRTVNYQPNSSYLLTGLIYCGECGFKYQGNARAAGRGKDSIYSSYRCGKRQNHKKDCTNGEIEKNRLETFVLEQMQKYLFNSHAITVIKDLVNKHNKEMAKIKSTDLIQYEQQLKNIESQINNLTNAIARGASEDIFIDKINTLTITKKELQDRIDNLIVKELPPVNEEDVKRAVSKLKEYIKSNDNFEIKSFMNQYIEKIVVKKEIVEVTLKVASAIFNSNYPNDKRGKVLIDLEISRDKLKTLPKQRRKVPTNAMFGEDYLKGYRAITNP